MLGAAGATGAVTVIVPEAATGLDLEDGGAHAGQEDEDHEEAERQRPKQPARERVVRQREVAVREPVREQKHLLKERLGSEAAKRFVNGFLDGGKAAAGATTGKHKDEV